MHINKTDLIYYIFASLALVLSFYTIVFHIGFTILPVVFLIAGAAISLLPGGNGLKVFFFLLPLINSLPAPSHKLANYPPTPPSPSAACSAAYDPPSRASPATRWL